jgi:hypothetical protein
MGKGMQPKKGYNQKKYDENYDSIDWSSTRKTRKYEPDEHLKKVWANDLEEMEKDRDIIQGG